MHIWIATCACSCTDLLPGCVCFSLQHPVALAPPVISRQSSSGSPSESVENEEFVPALPSPARGRGSGRGRGRTSKAVVAKVAQPVITHCFKNPAHKVSSLNIRVLKSMKFHSIFSLRFQNLCRFAWFYSCD